MDSMKKVLLVFLISIASQAQTVCPAVVYPCEIDYEGDVKPVGITQDVDNTCYLSAKKQCAKLLDYTCTIGSEDNTKELNVQLKKLNNQIKMLSLENKSLKAKLKRAKLKKK